MRKRHVRLTVLLLSLLLLALLYPSPASCQSTPAEGAVFPDISLPLPQRVEERNYLAVEEGPFKLSRIKSEIIILEIFSMYCPHCQKEAPVVNTLFKAISVKPELKSRIKLLGIGAGNTAFEVNAFRNLYNIEFPLLPDGNLAIHKLVGGVGTPYFFVLRNKGSRKLEVIYSKVGSFGEPDEFLNTILAKAGGKAKK
ncbi:MAG: TlpA disulfide reductase family protein [Syntrophobacter sp.]